MTCKSLNKSPKNSSLQLPVFHKKIKTLVIEFWTSDQDLLVYCVEKPVCDSIEPLLIYEQILSIKSPQSFSDVTMYLLS